MPTTLLFVSFPYPNGVERSVMYSNGLLEISPQIKLIGTGNIIFTNANCSSVRVFGTSSNAVS